MALIDWSDVTPSLAPHVPGVPDVTMREALAVMAAEFVRKAELLHETLDPIDTVPGTPEYDLFPELILESVRAASLDDAPLRAMDYRALTPHEALTEGRPGHYWLTERSVLRLWPVPDAVYELRVDVLVKPSRTRRGVEDWIYETWADALVSGAIWRLASLPNKSWSDAALAEYHRARFDRDISNARTWERQGTPLRVRAQRFT